MVFLILVILSGSIAGQVNVDIPNQREKSSISSYIFSYKSAYEPSRDPEKTRSLCNQRCGSFSPLYEQYYETDSSLCQKIANHLPQAEELKKDSNMPDEHLIPKRRSMGATINDKEEKVKGVAVDSGKSKKFLKNGKTIKLLQIYGKKRKSVSRAANSGLIKRQTVMEENNSMALNSNRKKDVTSVGNNKPATTTFSSTIVMPAYGNIKVSDMSTSTSSPSSAQEIVESVARANMQLQQSIVKQHQQLLREILDKISSKSQTKDTGGSAGKWTGQAVGYDDSIFNPFKIFGLLDPRISLDRPGAYAYAV